MRVPIRGLNSMTIAGDDSPVHRCLDVAFAALALALSWPVLLAVALAIRLDSPGPVLFVQTRTGRGGTPFRIYKFRTMRCGAPELPTHLVATSETTAIGRVLRRFKLDELPQLVNVLTGSMSLVGPRPCLLTQTQLIEARRRSGVLDVRPGITGLAQALGIDMSDTRRLVAIDAYYVATRSLAGDLRIMLATVLGPWLLRRSMLI